MSTAPSDFERERWLSEQSFRERELTLKERDQSEREAGGFEARKWEQERLLRERELSIKERAQATSEEDLALRQSEAARARWRSPLTVAIIAAALAALGNAVVAFVNGREGQSLEVTRAESARILEMIKTGNADKAAENLKFLADAGLVENPRLVNGIRTFLASRNPGQGPSLPVAAGAGSVEPVRGLRESDPMRVLARAVGELRSDQNSICTAFRLSQNLILTAEYCVKGFQTTPKSLTFAPISSNGDTAAISEVILPPKEVIQIASDSALAGPDFPMNVVILETTGPPDGTPDQLTLSASAPSPHQKLGAIALQLGPTGVIEPIVARDSSCSILEVSAHEFSHKCALSGGSAGAPLLSVDGVLVVGVEMGSSEKGTEGRIEWAVRADQIVANSKYLRKLLTTTPH
jgi:hypothetical protein